MRPRLAILMLLACIAASTIHAADPPQHILLVGNSYTGGIRSTLTAFVKASPHQGAHLEFITPGGKNLLFHAGDAKTIERIRDGNWDIVVLQDQSQTPALMPDRFLDGAKELHEVIAASGARTAYYETWGRRDGDKKNMGRMPTYEKMQDALSASYARAARRDQAILIPVGQAWKHVREKHPQLGAELYRKDGSHPSETGAYLATICFYARLFDADPEKVQYTGNLSTDVTEKLRAAALRTLQNYSRRGSSTNSDGS